MKSVVGVSTGSTNVKYFLVLKYAVVEMRNLCGFMTYFQVVAEKWQSTDANIIDHTQTKVYIPIDLEVKNREPAKN